MTKLKLKLAGNGVILSREEMKQVHGGYTGGSDNGSDNGSKEESTCYWYRCICSSPQSIMGSAMSTYVKGSSISDAVENTKDECSNYNQIDCKKDKPC